MKSFKFFLVFILFVFNLSVSSAIEISITPANVVNGEYYVVKGSNVLIRIKGTPNEQVGIAITSKFSTSSNSGKYQYFMDDFPIPIDVDFVRIKASPVANLKVKVQKLFIGKEFSANAKNDVAVININMSKIPISSKGTWDITIYGETNASLVEIEAKITASVNLDENGIFEINYDTSKLPVGKLIVDVDGNILKANIVESESDIPPTPTPTETPTPSPTPIPTPEPSSDVSPIDIPSPTHEETPTPQPTATPVVTPTATPTATSTPVPEITPTRAPTPTPTPKPTRTPTMTSVVTKTPAQLSTPERITTSTPLSSPTATVNVTQQENESSSVRTPGFELVTAIIGLILSVLASKRLKY